MSRGVPTRNGNFCLRQAQIQPWQLPITVLVAQCPPLRSICNMGHLGKMHITKLGYIKTSFGGFSVELLHIHQLKLKLQAIRIYAMIVNSIKDESIVGAGRNAYCKCHETGLVL